MAHWADQNEMVSLGQAAAKCPDQAFNARVLPGRPRRDRAVANPHRSDAVREGLSVSTIVVTDQIASSRCRDWSVSSATLRMMA
jgi:hypothetical protein